MDRINRIFYVDPRRELNNALDTWSLVDEEALGAWSPYFIMTMTDEALRAYIYKFKKALFYDKVSPEYSTAICRFFIKVIQYRRNAALLLSGFMTDVLVKHMKSEYMKGEYYSDSYVMAKKAIVWLSILYFEGVVRRLRFNFFFKSEIHAGLVDTLTEVISLCAKVVIPHIIDLLPEVSQVVKEARDQISKETLCHAIRRLAGSVQVYMKENNTYEVQLLTVMNEIKEHIFIWLHNVSAELQESVKLALEPFNVPKPVMFQPTTPDVQLWTLPHTEHLKKYRKQIVKEMKETEYTEKQRIEIGALVKSLEYDRKITKDFLQSLLDALKNGAPKARMIAAIFFSEALKHPKLIKQKYQESAICLFLKVTKQDDTSLCSVAMEGLGNAATFAPGLVEGYKNKIIAHLKSRLTKTRNTKVIMAALRVLSSIIRSLNLSVLCRQLINLCRKYIDYPDGELQIAAVNLLRDLTESCRLPLLSYFTGEIKSLIPTLLLKLHGDNREMAAACSSTLQNCFSYIKGKTIRGFFRKEKSPDISDLGSIYSYMAHYHKNLMRKMLLQIPECLLNSEDKEAVIRHVEFLKDNITLDALKPLDLAHLSRALSNLRSEDHPLNIRKATEKVVSILMTRWLFIKWARIPHTNLMLPFTSYDFFYWI